MKQRKPARRAVRTASPPGKRSKPGGGRTSAPRGCARRVKGPKTEAARPATHQYYTFAFGGVNAGWFELHRQGRLIAMSAHFLMEGQRIDNPFTLRLAGSRVSHVRLGDGPWTAVPAGAWPTSAYPLLVPRLADGETLDYSSFNEGRREVTGIVTLSRRGDLVEESHDGKVGRRFWLRKGTIVRIDWSGPISELRPSLKAAKKGSGLE